MSILGTDGKQKLRYAAWKLGGTPYPSLFGTSYRRTPSPKTAGTLDLLKQTLQLEGVTNSGELHNERTVEKQLEKVSHPTRDCEKSRSCEDWSQNPIKNQWKCGQIKLKDLPLVSGKNRSHEKRMMVSNLKN